jgi:hypothetical protein
VGGIHLAQLSVQYSTLTKTTTNLLAAKSEEFLDPLSDYQLLNKDSALWC